MAKISVIIPVYNVEKYLKECLDSVINQTIKDIEIICINDGSTDSSLELLKEYSEKDNRIVLIDKENEGVGKTRNLGIDVAKGDFVIFMDPDDFYMDKDVLEVLYNNAIENNVLICGGGFVTYNNITKEFSQNYPQDLDGYIFEKDALIDYKDYQFDYGYHRFIYNREFLIKNNIYFPLYKRFQDPPFFIKAMILAEKFYAVKKLVYGYRVGHADVKWTEEKINDLLCGLIDDMSYARKYNLKKLEFYTKERFKSHFRRCTRILNFNTLTKCYYIVGGYVLQIFIKKILQNIFSVKNLCVYKIITILGIKIAIKRKI